MNSTGIQRYGLRKWYSNHRCLRSVFNALLEVILVLYEMKLKKARFHHPHDYRYIFIIRNAHLCICHVSIQCLRINLRSLVFRGHQQVQKTELNIASIQSTRDTPISNVKLLRPQFTAVLLPKDSILFFFWRYLY